MTDPKPEPDLTLPRQRPVTVCPICKARECIRWRMVTPDYTVWHCGSDRHEATGRVTQSALCVRRERDLLPTEIDYLTARVVALAAEVARLTVTWTDEPCVPPQEPKA